MASVNTSYSSTSYKIHIKLKLIYNSYNVNSYISVIISRNYCISLTIIAKDIQNFRINLQKMLKLSIKNSITLLTSVKKRK